MSSERILVVDDEETVRITLAAVLAQKGYRVETAGSGGDALVAIHATDFDLILTDLRLDDFDGLRLLARVRERWPQTVTIMLTGYASLDSAVEALRQGAYDYLCKPCPADELLATVARGLERRRLSVQLQRRVRDLEVAIETARELYSALEARAEGTAALLEESQHVLNTTCDELTRSLCGISERARDLLDRVDPAAAREVDLIRSEADRLVQVVKAALEVAKSESVELTLGERQPQLAVHNPTPAA